MERQVQRYGASFWKGDEGKRADFARHFGFGRPLQQARRRPWARREVPTPHDGFNLNDLVSYNETQEANGRQFSDGTPTHHSWNHGVRDPRTIP